MNLDSGYKQIYLNNDTHYDALKGKIIEKVAFTNKGSYDMHMCIIIFTDKTFIALGTKYDEDIRGQKLCNEYIISPNQWNGGNFRCFISLSEDGNKIVKYDRYIQILKDLGIWNFTDEEELKRIKDDAEQKEAAEYKEYLRLKQKFEGK